MIFFKFLFIFAMKSVQIVNVRGGTGVKGSWAISLAGAQWQQLGELHLPLSFMFNWWRVTWLHSSWTTRRVLCVLISGNRGVMGDYCMEEPPQRNPKNEICKRCWPRHTKVRVSTHSEEFRGLQFDRCKLSASCLICPQCRPNIV